MSKRPSAKAVAVAGSNALLLGVDLGTTVLKAAVFRADSGETLASSAVRLAVRAEPDGTREQQPAQVLTALGRAARGLRRQVGADWVRVAGVGVSAQGGSAIIADRRTGRPLTPMQLWNDARPLARLSEIAARRPARWWRRLSYLDGPGAGLARMLWLRNRDAALFSPGNIYVGAGEFVYFHLTAQWRQDAGSAVQIGCYDARRRRLASRPLELIDVPADFVAPLRQGDATHPLSTAGGRLLGLPAGVPVAGPYMDHEAGYLGATDGGRPIQCSLGTAWVGNFQWPAGASLDSLGGINLVLPGLGGQGDFVVRVMLAGSLTLDWAVQTLLGGRDASARADGLLAERLLPPPGLVSLPWLTRPGLLAGDVVGAGGFIGVSTHTSRADLLRAAVAGLCCEFAHTLEPVVRSGHGDSVILTGGASRRPAIATLLATLLSPLPVRTIADDVFGVRGAVKRFARRRWPSRSVRVRPAGRALGEQVRGHHETFRRAGRALAAGLPDQSLLDDYRDGKRSPQ